MDKLHVDYIITGGLLSMTMIAGVATASINASADDVVDEINITIPTACTMGGTIIEGDEHTTSLQPGTYESGIGKTTLTTYCNDPGGFSIYAIGFTGDAYTGDNHTKLVGNNASNTISTGLTTGTSNSDASSWAMKLSAVAGTYAPTIMDGTNDTEDFTNYHIVPDTYTKVATYGNTTDAEGGTGSSLETTYAVYASLTQPADTYAGKVKYTLVHPASEVPAQPQTTQSGQICYYANATDAVGTMGCQNVSSSVTLLASNFSRTGYGFAGWSDAFDYKTNENAKFYGPQETITLTPADYQSPNNGLSLYAVWVKSAGNLQDTEKVAELCGTGANALATAPTDGTANLDSVSALTDQRDNETYAIAKLADGNCWMIENLRLENTNSDNATGTLAQGYNTSFAGLADPEAASLFTSTATANTLYSTDGSTEKTISGSNQGYRFPRYNNVNTPTAATDRPSNPTTNSSTNSTSNAGMYSYGNYYTWAAAIADTTAYTSNNTSVTNTSICPTGWHLPKGGSSANATNSDFWQLGLSIMGAAPSNNSQYKSSETNAAGKTATAAFRSYPNNFVYSGDVNSGSVYFRGSTGLYWSSTAYSSNNAYVLYLYSSLVYPGTSSSYKYYGRTVRCVAPGV